MRRTLAALVVGVSLAAACAGEDGSAGPTTTSATLAPTTVPTTAETIADDEPSDRVVVHDPDAFPIAEGAIVPEGFERVQAVVTTTDGRQCELCLWLADDGSLRSRGLMAVDDIGLADGMAFVYPEPDTRTFTMNNVRIDLEIAFFDAERIYINSFAMEACPAGGCGVSYPTPDGITIAVEVRPGTLPDLGIGPGSTIEITDLPCA